MSDIPECKTLPATEALLGLGANVEGGYVAVGGEMYDEPMVILTLTTCTMLGVMQDGDDAVETDQVIMLPPAAAMVLMQKLLSIIMRIEHDEHTMVREPGKDQL